MKQHLKLVVEDMREELKPYLPQRIIDRIEPTDVIKMHEHKCGNDILKEQYRLTTQQYIDMMCHYDALSRIIYK